jgi:hypothetical protein
LENKKTNDEIVGLMGGGERGIRTITKNPLFSSVSEDP